MVEEQSNHRSGFVNIIGLPNVGKSTLMNALVGERMSIITRKPQTTRHRILGILSGADFQIVFSDTPGFVRQPSYRMHESMNKFVLQTYEDADIFLFVIDASAVLDYDHTVIRKLRDAEIPVFAVINKIDLVDKEKVAEIRQQVQEVLPGAKVFEISALHKLHTDMLLREIRQALPTGPAYFPRDQLTDRPERFFVSEIIREQILELYHDEIPYSTEIVIESFREEESRKGPLIRIRALIFVMRRSQKAILIGKNGSAIKELGTRARKEIETFLDQHVFLELYVKVKENWRDDDRLLKQFGYKN